MAAPAPVVKAKVEAQINTLVTAWKNDLSKKAFQEILKLTLNPNSTPESLIEHHVKVIADSNMDVIERLNYAFVIGRILYDGNKTLKAISEKDFDNMYSWYKIGTGDIHPSTKPGGTVADYKWAKRIKDF